MPNHVITDELRLGLNLVDLRGIHREELFLIAVVLLFSGLHRAALIRRVTAHRYTERLGQSQ